MSITDLYSDDYKKANRKATQYVKGLAVESSEGEATYSKRRRTINQPSTTSFQEPKSTLYTRKLHRKNWTVCLDVHI